MKNPQPFGAAKRIMAVSRKQCGMLRHFFFLAGLFCLTQGAAAVPISIAPGALNGANNFPFNFQVVSSPPFRLQVETDASAFAALGGPALLTSMQFSLGASGSTLSFPTSTLRVGLTSLDHDGKPGIEHRVRESVTAERVLGTHEVH